MGSDQRPRLTAISIGRNVAHEAEIERHAAPDEMGDDGQNSTPFSAMLMRAGAGI